MRVTLTLSSLLLAAAATAPAQNIPRIGGHPDLSGSWLHNFATPLERPAELANHPTLTDAEVVELNIRAKRIFAADSGSDAAASDAFFMAAWHNIKQYRSGGATDSAERVTDLVIDNRTSIITDPADGKIPALTANGQRRRAEYQRSRVGNGNPGGPEEVAPGDRCITYSVPRIQGVYAAGLHGYYQLVQTRDHLMIYSENIHEFRIVSLTGRPHPPAFQNSWSGDSVGRWEGDTLVVDTTNFKPQLHPLAISGGFHMTERLTRVSADEIRYEIKLEDPDTWVRPWSVMMRLKQTPDMLFESACHEGNAAIMKTILLGDAKN